MTPRRSHASGLSREAIAAAALEILDRDGIDGLTMRRLAEALGVGTMTLYGYVRTKDELLDAAVDAAFTDTPRVAPTGTWRDRSRQLALDAWHVLARHPALVQIRMRQPVVRVDALRFGEAGMTILLDAGFPPDDAAQAFRLLFTYTFGSVGLSPPGTANDASQRVRAALAALPPEAYPRLTQTRTEFSEAVAGAESFTYGLDRILDGLEAHLAATRPERRGS